MTTKVECPHCGVEYPLRQNGRLISHRVRTSIIRDGNLDYTRCDGSGEKPKQPAQATGKEAP